jgi:hypothetical protein
MCVWTSEKARSKANLQGVLCVLCVCNVCVCVCVWVCVCVCNMCVCVCVCGRARVEKERERERERERENGCVSTRERAITNCDTVVRYVPLGAHKRQKQPHEFRWPKVIHCEGVIQHAA